MKLGMARTGIGFDVHPLVAGRLLIIGGVTIPFEKGLDGHSDADVLVHAIMDALLGAAGLGDIGQQFPDKDPQYRNASSLQLLGSVAHRIRGAGWNIVNLDATLIAQEPKIAPHREAMIRNIAHAAGLDAGRVNVKATTTEGLGWAGRGEGMAALATALIEKEG